MKTARSFLLALPLAFLLLTASCSSPPYTAKVVDAETGEPIEGAVYLAVWWTETGKNKSWFEGPSPAMSKFEEGYTDEKGEIHVPRFWWRYPFAKKRTLTVYQPGYVLWNQEYIFPDSRMRSDFTKKNSLIPIERWKPDYRYSEQNSLLLSSTHGCMLDNFYLSGSQLLYKTYNQYELPKYMEELMRK